jgi:magnesium chelatase family protein
MLAARLPSILPPLARTLADLDGKATVGCIHLAEAISYRIAGERMTAAA